jgi:hypothetical protein
MVHALRQARRVLNSQGHLLDLRPAPVHRHVSIEHDGTLQHLAVMKEDFSDDYAANRAVKELVITGELVLRRRIRFDCTRRMDRFSDFETWLDEYVRLGKIRSHESLLHKVQEMLRTRSWKASIVVQGPVDLRVLVKN